MKKFIFSAAILGLVAPIALATTSASADTVSGQTATTTADVTFTGSAFPTPLGPVDPTNPTNPDNPGTKDNPTNNPDQPVNPNGPAAGPVLQLLTAPAFHFGSVDLSTITDAAINPIPSAKNAGATGGSKLFYAQVSDTRGGSLGWQLSVSNTGFVGANKAPLNNAVLTLAAPTIVTSDKSTPAGTDATAATLNGSGTASPVVAIKAGEGAQGTTSINWSPSQIGLTFDKSSAQQQAYSSTLTWALGSNN